MSDQEPPADTLYRIRQEIKALEDREEVLKALMLNDPSARTGNRYIVEIKEVARNQVDITELRSAYPAEVAEHTHKVTNIRLELREIDEDGVITHVKRRRHETV